MPTTAPFPVWYPDDTSPVAPLEGLFSTMAASINTQLGVLQLGAFTNYAKKADLDLAPGTRVGQHASVNADPNPLLNGDYRWTGTLWLATVNGSNRTIPTSVVGGTVSGGTINFAGVTAVSVNGVFSSAYDNYHIELVGTCALATQLTTLILRAAGVDSSAGNYDYTLAYSLGTPAATNLNGRTSFQLGAANAMTNFKASVDISSPFLAQLTTITAASTGYASAAAPLLGQLSGGHRLQSSFDGFTITFAIPASGSIRVYGWNN